MLNNLDLRHPRQSDTRALRHVGERRVGLKTLALPALAAGENVKEPGAAPSHVLGSRKKNIERFANAESGRSHQTSQFVRFAQLHFQSLDAPFVLALHLAQNFSGAIREGRGSLRSAASNSRIARREVYGSIREPRGKAG
jgi:hypothetical protein